MDIAARIDLAMKVAGIKTQSQLAQASGVPLSTIARVLKNGGTPTIENLAAIAVALNRSLDWIVNGTDSPKQDLPELVLTYVTHKELRLLQQLREATEMGESLILIAGDAAEKKPLSANDD
jgi:transcriptional regulator with XRE-family HTH domain